jgi:hypothetical protein
MMTMMMVAMVAIMMMMMMMMMMILILMMTLMMTLDGTSGSFPEQEELFSVGRWPTHKRAATSSCYMLNIFQ